MGFIEEYKRLDRLCQDIMKVERGITTYIEKMEACPSGFFYTESWNADLKMLKHCRWIRNKISHEPGCSEDNMCSPDDELWLSSFYNRILNQTDPLALYHKAQNTETLPTAQTAQKQPAIPTEKSEESSLHRIAHKKNKKRILLWFGKILVVLLLVAILLFLAMVTQEFLQLI